MPHRGSYRGPVTKAKAGEVLRHGKIGERNLTLRQKGLFGAIRGGQRLRLAGRGKKKMVRRISAKA